MDATATDFIPAFKVAHGTRRAECVTRGTGADTFLVEARQTGHHLKEAVVTEGDAGGVWRVASDEGTFMKGTDLAPFPLGFFNAGIQSDLAGRIVREAKAAGIALRGLSLRVVTEYSLSGSFAAGTGQGYAEGVSIEADISADASAADCAALLRKAVDASPAVALLRKPLENTFSLHCNGRRRDPSSLPVSPAASPTDPFLKYAKAPSALSGPGIAEGLIVKTADKTVEDPSDPNGGTNAQGRITWKVNGTGHYDFEENLYRCRVALNRPGSTQFTYVSDETEADRAPCGLTLLSAGIAFCYMTQLSRYIENMKLPIHGVRLVQVSPFAAVAGGHGMAEPCDTHLFMQGEADEAMFDRLQLIAANTCYLHRSMAIATPVEVVAKKDGTEVVRF